MATPMQDVITEYFDAVNESKELRVKQKNLRKKIDDIQNKIKKYMIENDISNLSFEQGDIVMYEKKIPQTFKKENIIETLTEELKDNEKATEITHTILSNKKFLIENSVKAVVKKASKRQLKGN
jgi:predicted metal-dependent RNase